jgi:vacuolar protein sorting-associated protein 35
LTQPYVTRRMLAHAIISSVLKNEAVDEDPEDVHGILELCQVLIREQPDAAPPPPGTGARRGPFGVSEREDVAEEQGWVARVVHLFRSETLGAQFEVRFVLQLNPACRADNVVLSSCKLRHLEAGGDRMRFTFPAVITCAIKLCRRYKSREHLVDDWASRVETILKFVRQLTSILAIQVDAPTIALRLFLFAAQIADECGFEDLAYDLYVEAFTVYEEGISEARASCRQSPL